jgi:TonB family protein
MRTIVAILALSSAVSFGQAKVPAQPSSTPVLQSALVNVNPLYASAAAAAAGSPVRISTGVTPPKLIHSVALDQSGLYLPQLFNTDRTVVIDMTVDATGKPTDLKLAKSADLVTNTEVIAAVSQFRYQPATVSGVAVAIPVKLEYTITRNR